MSGFVGSDPIEPSLYNTILPRLFRVSKESKRERSLGVDSAVNSGVVLPGILGVDVSANWETPPGASGGRVLPTFLPLLDLPAVYSLFCVLLACSLRNPATS
jgi:hypothetical protein